VGSCIFFVAFSKKNIVSSSLLFTCMVYLFDMTRSIVAGPETRAVHARLEKPAENRQFSS
jgi:hypothetical protein